MLSSSTSSSSLTGVLDTSNSSSSSITSSSQSINESQNTQNSQYSQKILKQTPLKGHRGTTVITEQQQQQQQQHHPLTPRKPLLDCTNKGGETPLSKIHSQIVDDPATSNNDSNTEEEDIDNSSWFIEDTKKQETKEQEMPISQSSTLQKSLNEALKENEILFMTNKALTVELDELTKKLQDLEFISILYEEAKNEIKELENTILSITTKE